MIENALLRKELTVNLRTRRAVVLLLAFVSVLAGLTILMWPASGLYSIEARGTQHLFVVLSYGQLSLVVLFGPAFGATALTLEKEKNTFDVLYGTYLTPLQIVIGKVGGSLAHVVLLVLMGLPLTALCFFPGGVTVEQTVWVYGLIALSAAFYGLLGLFVSARCRHSYSAIIWTYALVIVFAAGVEVPAALFGELPLGDARVVLECLRALSPFEAMTGLLAPGISEVAVGGVAAPTVYAIFSAGGALVFLASTYQYLRKPRQPVARATRDAGKQGTVARVGRNVFYLYFFNPRRRTYDVAKKAWLFGMIGRWVNPVAIKEFRCRAFGRAHWVVRSFAACLIVSLVLATVTVVTLVMVPVAEGGMNRIIQAIAVFQTGLIVLIGPSLGSASISGEREAGVFDLLRMTPLRSSTIIFGKLKASLMPMLLLLLATTPVSLTILYIEPAYGPRMVESFSVLLLAGVFSVSVGVMFSTVFARTSAATTAAYGVVMTMFVATLLAWLACGTVLSEAAARIFFLVNPLIVTMERMDVAAISDLRLDLLVDHWLLMGGLTALALAIAIGRAAVLIRPTR